MTKERKIIEKIINKIDQIAKKGKDYINEYYRYIDDLVQKGEYSYFQQALDLGYKIDTLDIPIPDVKKKTWKEILFQTNSTFLTKLKKIYDTKSVYQIGFNIYNQDLNRIQLSLSSVLSTTYSVISLTPSIAMTMSNGIIYLNAKDGDTFNINISKADWTMVNSINTPTNQSLIQQIIVTQSATFSTTISTTYAHKYLIELSTRSTPIYSNHEFSITQNTYLGQIKEVDNYSPDVKYLIENKEFAKLMNNKTTYLEVVKLNSDIELVDDTNYPWDLSLTNDQNLLIRYTAAIDILLSQ